MLTFKFSHGQYYCPEIITVIGSLWNLFPKVCSDCCDKSELQYLQFIQAAQTLRGMKKFEDGEDPVQRWRKGPAVVVRQCFVFEAVLC